MAKQQKHAPQDGYPLKHREQGLERIHKANKHGLIQTNKDMKEAQTYITKKKHKPH